YNMGNPTFALRWKEVELAARALGAESQLLDVRKPEDIAPAFAAATAQRAGALLTTVDALIQANQRTILELAAKHRLPAIYPTREFVEKGGLMAYGVSYPDLYLGQRPTSTRFSRAPDRPIFRLSSRPSSN